MEFSTARIRAIRRRILAWYDRKHRELPWRMAAPDPYFTLVSEFMLQQTQAATVIPYYERFIERFPQIIDLAEASVDDVLPYWAGLGYYRRCHHLHRAARMIVDQFDGRVPDSAERLRTLPGVGGYTAGAIASIAFGRREACVDGNVRRVLTRASRGSDDAAIEELAQSLVPLGRPGDFNQALMDLGATVCTPRAPRCSDCPLRTLCPSAESFAQKGSGGIHPFRSKASSPSPVLHMVSLAILSGSKAWYRRRPDAGLWSGLWEWPTAVVQSPGEDEAAAAGAVVATLLRQLKPSMRAVPRCLFRSTHVLTHRRVIFDVFRVDWRGAGRPRGEGTWQALDAAIMMPVSAAQRRMIERLRTSMHGSAHG